MKIVSTIFIVSLLSSGWHHGHAQGFVNLDFESATLSPIPSGQFGGVVSSTAAIPGWTGFLGVSQIEQVLQNNLTLGGASIDILTPNWNNFGGISIIAGQYTVILQSGADPLGGSQIVSASISQTGLVPANAKSIQFQAAANNFSVSLGGQSLSLVTLGTGVNYTLYGAEISSFAGQTSALTIAALAQPNSGGRFDSIVFSPSPIPEPSAPCLERIWSIASRLPSLAENCGMNYRIVRTRRSRQLFRRFSFGVSYRRDTRLPISLNHRP